MQTRGNPPGPDNAARAEYHREHRIFSLNTGHGGGGGGVGWGGGARSHPGPGHPTLFPEEPRPNSGRERSSHVVRRNRPPGIGARRSTNSPIRVDRAPAWVCHGRRGPTKPQRPPPNRSVASTTSRRAGGAIPQPTRPRSAAPADLHRQTDGAPTSRSSARRPAPPVQPTRRSQPETWSVARVAERTAKPPLSPVGPVQLGPVRSAPACAAIAAPELPGLAHGTASTARCPSTS